MQFVIKRDILLKSLNFVQGVVEKKNTLPILSNVLIELKGKKLSIVATDLDIVFKDEIDDVSMFELAIESGANECFSHENFHEVHTANTEIYEVKNKLEKKIENFLSTEIEWVPLNTVNLSGENKDNMIKFLETLDDDEDVQNIFTNAKFEN